MGFNSAFKGLNTKKLIVPKTQAGEIAPAWLGLPKTPLAHDMSLSFPYDLPRA